MSQSQVHRASCHCQAVVFTVNTSAEIVPESCDCSHCSKLGILWSTVKPDDFVLEKGGDKLSEYSYGNGSVRQLSCGTCGTFLGRGKDGVPFANEDGVVFFNVRAIRGVDPHDLKPEVKIHKRDDEPRYIPAPALTYSFPTPSAVAKDKETVVYHGSCHCKAVRFLVRSGPLGDEDVEVTDCNCHMCGGNGAIWVYPKHEDYYFPPEAKSHLAEYAFTPDSPSQNRFSFCKTCSCTIYESRAADDGIGLNVRLIDFNDDEDDRGGRKGTARGGGDLVRGLEGEGLAVKADGRSDEPSYVLP